MLDDRPLYGSPPPVLRPFVQSVWASGHACREPSGLPTREHVLPTGQMHLVIRLADDPLRLFANTADTSGHLLSAAVVGGARASFYIREVSRPPSAIGAQLRPGASEALFGVPASELAGRHTALEDLWGRDVARMREQLAALASPTDRLHAFEGMLAARLPLVRGIHPAVASALEQFVVSWDVRDEVKRSGFSHRTFIAMFRRAVGLSPKVYCRLIRFQRALALLSRSSESFCVDVALAAGYSDQSHFNREFREFTGVTPTEYRRLSPTAAHHLPIGRGSR